MNGTPSLRERSDQALRVLLGPTAPPPAAPISSAAPPGPAPPTPFAWDPPPGFHAVDQDFLLYHPDVGAGRAVFGMLVDAIPLWFQASATQPGLVVPALHGLVIQLIEPTLVLDPSASRRLVEAKPGQEILVAADHLALRRLVRAAVDPNAIGEVWMRPDPAVRLQYGPDHQAAWIVLAGKTFPRASLKRNGQR